jgi:hypothetical protein
VPKILIEIEIELPNRISDTEEMKRLFADIERETKDSARELSHE